MKTVLLAATAVILFSTISAPAVAAPPRAPFGTLYTQNSNFGTSPVNSQNFTSSSFGTANNDAAADDFVVPSTVPWSISEVDVTGVYFNGTGATSEVVTFYMNYRGKPGPIAGRGKFTFTLSCTDSAGSFACSLPLGRRGLPEVRFRAGAHAWVSVVANCSFVGGCGYWDWIENTVVHNKPAVWQNPGNGDNTGCTKWTAFASCFGGSPADLAFALKGAD